VKLRVGSLEGVREHAERLVLGDLVPLHQDAFRLLDTRARHPDGAQVHEIIAGPGVLLPHADRNRDPGSNLFGQLKIIVVETSGLPA
jgi:hypothetical protein